MTLKTYRNYTLLFILILLLGQMTGLLHSHNLDQHPDELQCALCLHSANLEHGLTISSNTLVVMVLAGFNSGEFRQLRFHSNHPYSYQSRAPPTIS